MTPEERAELRDRIDKERRRLVFGRDKRHYCIECGELANACACKLPPQDNGTELEVEDRFRVATTRPAVRR